MTAPTTQHFFLVTCRLLSMQRIQKPLLQWIKLFYTPASIKLNVLSFEKHFDGMSFGDTFWISFVLPFKVLFIKCISTFFWFIYSSKTYLKHTTNEGHLNKKYFKCVFIARYLAFWKKKVLILDCKIFFLSNCHSDSSTYATSIVVFTTWWLWIGSVLEN